MMRNYTFKKLPLFLFACSLFLFIKAVNASPFVCYGMILNYTKEAATVRITTPTSQDSAGTFQITKMTGGASCSPMSTSPKKQATVTCNIPPSTNAQISYNFTQQPGSDYVAAMVALTVGGQTTPEAGLVGVIKGSSCPQAGLMFPNGPVCIIDKKICMDTVSGTNTIGIKQWD